MRFHVLGIWAFGSIFLAACGGGGASSAPVIAPPSGGGGGSGSGGNSVDLPIPSSAPNGPDYHPEGQGWVLNWSDEFTGTELDRNKWEVEESCWGGGNEERQCYTDRDRNVEVINGLLRLKSYPEVYTGIEYPQGWPGGRGGQITQQYTSGKVRTRELADWTYGRFSARMKLPKGQGTWPALWMLPSDNVYGTWAASGEIDILETVNLGADCSDCSGGYGENRAVGSLHFGDVFPENTFKNDKRIIPGGAAGLDEYHVYSIEWGEGKIHWFLDGELYLTLSAEDWFSGGVAPEVNPNAPFDQDFYLMINLAVGGNFPENTNENRFDATSFPAEVLVDWVRVYQCEFDGTTGRSCMTEGSE